MSNDPIVLPPLTRGDRRTINITDLTDDADQPAVFNVSDVLRWTAKRSRYDPDRKALIVKISPAGGITFTPGTSSATITLLPADFPKTPGDIDYVWDLQIALGGSATNTRTLAHGTGTIDGDVGITAP